MSTPDLHEAFKKAANDIVGPSKVYSDKDGARIEDGCLTIGNEVRLFNRFSLGAPRIPLDEIAQVSRFGGLFASAERDGVRIKTKKGGESRLVWRREKADEFRADIRAIREGVRSLLGLQELTEPRVNDEPPRSVPQWLDEVIADCATWGWASWFVTTVVLLAVAVAMVYIAEYSGWVLPQVLATWAIAGGYVQAGLPFFQSAKRRGWRRPWLARRVPGGLMLLLVGFWMSQLSYDWDDPQLGWLAFWGIGGGLLVWAIPHEKGD
jgi:hypothetical protein